jgi:hypothetical protein
VLLGSVGALFVTLGVASYGLLEGSRALVLIGLVAGVSIGVAMTFRARDSIRSVETAYARLDRALVDAERNRDELSTANEELARANVQIQAMHVAFADLLNLADERASLLEEQMERRGRG